MPKPQPLTYTVIPSGFGANQSAEKEQEVFGIWGATRYQTGLFTKMDYMCAGEYNGGVWELRQYENGAVAWVFPKEGLVNTKTFNGNDPVCNFEGVALAANLIEMSALMGELAGRTPVNEAQLLKIRDNFDRLYDVCARLEQWVAIRRIID